MCVFNAYGKYNNAGWPGETDLKKKRKGEMQEEGRGENLKIPNY